MTVADETAERLEQIVNAAHQRHREIDVTAYMPA